MKTPYDPVVRVGAREMEAMREALRREMARVAGLARDAAALSVRVREECALAEGDPQMRTDHWVRARKAQAAAIAHYQAEAEAGLAQVRGRALAAYGRLRAAEQAASAYIDRANAEADRKAQAEADDLGNARRLLKLRRRMRARRGGGADGLVDAA